MPGQPVIRVTIHSGHPPVVPLSVDPAYEELFVYFMPGPGEQVDEIVYLSKPGSVTLSAPLRPQPQACYFVLDVRGALGPDPCPTAAEANAQAIRDAMAAGRGTPSPSDPERRHGGGGGGGPPGHRPPPAPPPPGAGGSGGGTGPGPIKSHPAGS